MDEMQACRLWIQRDWSMIPTSLLEKAYPYPEDIEILAPTFESFRKQYFKDYCKGEGRSCEECKDEYCVEAYNDEVPIIPMWGYVFVPDDIVDARWWLQDHAEEIAKECGVIVYYTDEIGPYIGINGAGYDFYKAHWIKLYRLRGLKWHDEEDKR